MHTYRKKLGYQDKNVAESYFEKRFAHPKGRKENEETSLALERALNSIPGVKTILDMPCGSGRFTDFFMRGNIPTLAVMYQWKC